MSILRVLMSLILIITFSAGCASRNAVNQPSLYLDLKSHQNKVVKNDITLLVKPIHKLADLKAYYDEDAIRYGVLPVQIFIQNQSDDNYILNTDGINLTSSTGERIPALSAEQTYQRLRKSYWRSGGWAVAVGVFAAFSVHNVSKINNQIKADLSSRMLQSGNLISGSATEGTIFYDVPPKIDSVNNWKITLVIQNGLTNELTQIEYSMAGNVEQRVFDEEEAISNQ